MVEFQLYLGRSIARAEHFNGKVRDETSNCVVGKLLAWNSIPGHETDIGEPNQTEPKSKWRITSTCQSQVVLLRKITNATQYEAGQERFASAHSLLDQDTINQFE